MVPRAMELGELRVAEVTAIPGALAQAGLFLLILQLEGASTLRQEEREAKLAAGDFTMCATDRPIQVAFTGAARCLEIAIPDSLMRRHVTCPDAILAMHMSGSRGFAGVLSNFIRTFWTCGIETLDPAVALRMAHTLLDLIAAVYCVIPHAARERSSLVAAHRARIISYIEAHLRDPKLNPTAVARGCRITARYLHHLFASGSETVTQYIQRRRLEECARALVAAPVRARLVTEIAFDYGFNSLTHFGRVFRHQYGLTPSEYRRATRN